MVVSCKRETNNSSFSTGFPSIDSTLLKSQNQVDTGLESSGINDPIGKIEPEALAKQRYHDSLYAEKIKAQAEKSKNKTKSCEQILKEFNQIANKVIASKNPNLFKEEGWNKNDPAFQACLQGDESFKKSYYEINDKMKLALK